MRLHSIVSWVASTLAVAAFAGLLVLSDDPFLMVGGSDSTSFLFGPPIAVQCGAAIVFAAAMLVPARPVWWVARLIAVLAAIVVGGHRVVVDNVRYELRDVYAGVPVGWLTLDPALEGGLTVTHAGLGLRVGQVGAEQSLWLFSPAIVGLDEAAIRAASA